jgi:hypothetical protein
MPERKTETSKKCLPKFDSVPALGIGTAFSLLLIALNLWALAARWHDAFFPYQLAKLLGAAFGLALAVHCVDMMAYYKKHGRLKR